MTCPQFLTRFYGTPAFALEFIEQRQLAFVRATILNDPFDLGGFLETDFDGYAGLIKHVKKSHPKAIGWFRALVPLGVGAERKKRYVTT